MTHLTSLTEMETLVLKEMFFDAKGNGHDFGFVENITCLPMTQVRGILSSLVKKDIIEIHDYRHEMGMEEGCTQWTWNHAGDRNGLIPKSIQDVLPKA
jgi:hypothetical protein